MYDSPYILSKLHVKGINLMYSLFHKRFNQHSVMVLKACKGSSSCKEVPHTNGEISEESTQSSNNKKVYSNIFHRLNSTLNRLNSFDQ